MSQHAIPVPYTSRLLNQIQSGQTLTIKGTVNESAERFEVNLLNNCTEIGSHGSAPFHISVRFDEGKVVLNSFLDGEWEKEERHSNPFHKGQMFDIRIRVHEDKYEITANQKHLADFKHREEPYTTVDYLQVKGDVTLTSVHWGGRYFDVPFQTSFHGGYLHTGQRVCIYGTPKGDFSVNFVGANGDNLFHFNPRFGDKKVVRNSQKNGEWENEEREGAFTFKKNIGFDLVIHNEPYSIQIFLDGNRFGTFAHRTEPNNYKSLRIEGDVEITGVEVSH